MANTQSSRTQGGSHTGTTTSDLKTQAQQAGTSFAEQAKNVASSAAQTVSDTASNLGAKAEQLSSSAAAGLHSLAGTIRENMPREGMLGSASSAVAQTLESGSRYLEREGFSGLADDLTALVRRNPVPAVLVGFGLGFILARAFRS